MKIKNLAFFGIMAAILGVESSARADTTTIIASQAYVDAKDDLKQDKGDRVTITKTAYDALNPSKTTAEKQAEYPSMYTLEEAISTAASNASGMKDSAASATWDGTNHVLSIVTTDNTAGNKTDKVATSNQVQTSISALKEYTDYSKQAKSTANYSMGKSDGTWQAMSDSQQNALNSGITSSLVSALQTLDSAVEAGIDEELYTNWVSGGRKHDGAEWNAIVAAWSSIDNVVSDDQTSHQTKIPRNANIQKGIAYLKGSGIENHTTGINGEKDSNVAGYATSIENSTIKDAADTAWTAEFTNKVADDHVPTVAAVEARVKKAETAAGTSLTNAKDDTASATYSNGAVAFATSGQDGNQTTKLATSHAVKEGLEAIKSYADNKLDALDGGTISGTGVVTAISQDNGNVSATLSTIGSSEITDKSIQYQFDMNNTALFDINTGAVPASGVCEESNPCVLTYYKKGGKVYTRWTPMDTEDTSANSSTDDAGASVS